MRRVIDDEDLVALIAEAWKEDTRAQQDAPSKCPRDKDHVYGGPCPVCGAILTLDKRNWLLQLSARSNEKALAKVRERGFERIVDDPLYEDFVNTA
jgi:hypothetical protein